MIHMMIGTYDYIMGSILHDQKQSLNLLFRSPPKTCFPWFRLDAEVAREYSFNRS
jgi:hypothetical protein